MQIFDVAMNLDLQKFYSEDEIHGNSFYLNSLPTEEVICQLKIKSDMILSGFPFFVAAFNFIGAKLLMDEFKIYEGKKILKGEMIEFKLPFNIALTGERVALNLLQTSSSISTHTHQIVELLKSPIKVLDTRKTTPGLRNLEKYAVRLGGGYNHRMSQTDVFMIKDNHKTFFGSLQKAYEFFQSMQTFYNPIVVEIHSFEEFEQALSLGVNHVMLDNFTPEQILEVVKNKKNGMTIELSGGINSSNIKNYCIVGIDAISMGSLTYGAPHVDISMKIKKIN